MAIPDAMEAFLTSNKLSHLWCEFTTTVKLCFQEEIREDFRGATTLKCKMKYKHMYKHMQWVYRGTSRSPASTLLEQRNCGWAFRLLASTTNNAFYYDCWHEFGKEFCSDNARDKLASELSPPPSSQRFIPLGLVCSESFLLTCLNKLNSS